MSLDTIQLRAGRLDDLPVVAAFTQNTFEWGDYITRAWERWVNSERGDLLVAEIGGVLVGTIHVRYLGQREAWLEGLRVQPASRQQGVATTLMQAVHARARKKHCRIIRLETADRNTNARRIFERVGYAQRAQYATFEAKTGAGEIARVRAAKLSDAETCAQIWQTSRFRQSARNLVPAAYGWRWCEFSAARLREAVRARNVWLTRDARAFMVTRASDSFDVTMLAGPKNRARELMDAAIHMAHAQGFETLRWFVVSGAQSAHWAETFGFEPDDTGMLIYEYAL